MARLSLPSLIQAIANAVADAQESVKQFQVAAVGSYFDANNRPKSVEVRVPSLSPGAAPGDEDVIRVPLLAVVAPQLLSIKDVEVSLEVGLTGLSVDGTLEANAADAASSAHPGGWPLATTAAGALGVDLTPGKQENGVTKATVTLRVESQPPSEGMARLLQRLNQTI